MHIFVSSWDCHWAGSILFQFVCRISCKSMLADTSYSDSADTGPQEVTSLRISSSSWGQSANDGHWTVCDYSGWANPPCTHGADDKKRRFSLSNPNAWQLCIEWWLRDKRNWKKQHIGACFQFHFRIHWLDFLRNPCRFWEFWQICNEVAHKQSNSS